MKNKCKFCETEQDIRKSDIKVWKASKELIEKNEENKKLVEEKYTEFKEEYKKISFWKNFWKFLCLDTTCSFLQDGNFDSWLFSKYIDIYDKKLDIEFLKADIKYWKCKFCGRVHYI